MSPVRQRRFIQCDVFTSVPTKGAGLAVVVDGEGLSDIQMQTFAVWTNLAETAFLLSPTTQDADYKVRIFTPKRELPFAGFPTLGSCAAWLHAGGKSRKQGVVKQECRGWHRRYRCKRHRPGVRRAGDENCTYAASNTRSYHLGAWPPGRVRPAVLAARQWPCLAGP